MRTALYFPGLEVKSEAIVRTALLTWDRLEFIAPVPAFKQQYVDRRMTRAMDLLGHARVPTKAEQDRVHDLVVDLLKDDVPEIFRYSPANGRGYYEIWPQKFASRTWSLLTKRGLTAGQLRNKDYPTSHAAGLSLMAILADVLAGDTRARITDQGLAYATIANASKPASKPSERVHMHDQVVPLTFKAIAVDRLPIERLIEFREREEKEGGKDYRALRHQSLDAIDKHVAAIATTTAGSIARIELDRVFGEVMEHDLRALKAELGFAKRDAWLSKDMMTLALAGGARRAANVRMSEAIADDGRAVALGGFLGSGNKLAKARREIRSKHPMSYLYEINS